MANTLGGLTIKQICDRFITPEIDRLKARGFSEKDATLIVLGAIDHAFNPDPSECPQLQTPNAKLKTASPPPVALTPPP